MTDTNSTEAQHPVRVPPINQANGSLSGAPLLAARTRAERSGPA